jgi:cytochrome c oxidase cbb3-type subunit I/II
VGVPYPAGYEAQAVADLQKQASSIVTSLKTARIETPPEREIIALIAYLQRLGTDIKASNPAGQAAASVQP